LEALAAQLGITQNVIFAGPVENGARYLRVFDLFVMPSFTEGFGRGAVEAMYAGLPVVASRVGGLCEIVEHDRTGRLVPSGEPRPLAEAILFYLGNESQRREHGEDGRRRAHERFDPEQYAALVAEFYSQLLKKRNL